MLGRRHLSGDAAGGGGISAMNGFTPSPEQNAIIGHDPVPVRIAAGAGTGKTTTIVERLARAVANGADPARALGITFTNKAADELRYRLRMTIPERADGREVEVATYHGFAAGLLDEFGAHIGHPAGAQLMDEAHRSELAIRVLREYDGDLLDLTALPQRRDELLMLASNMRDNLVTAKRVRADAPSDPDATWQKRLALVDAVEEFEAAKVALGLIEYGDLLRLAVEIVENHPEVVAEVRSRYDMVLLDEYQDTDPVQRRLLRELFGDGTSVTAVGDTDQTIYEWRGASIENFEEFPNDFPQAEGGETATLPLSINRRSDRSIIEMANLVKTELPDAGGAAPLVASPSAADGTIVAAWLNSESDEADWIARDILVRHSNGVPYAEIAVLCRKRDGMRPIADAFRAAGIPYSVGSMGELLNVPEITDLVAWLSVLADPSDEASLLRILTGGRYRLGMSEVAALIRSRPAKTSTLIDAVLADDVGTRLEGADFDEKAHESASSFASVYRELFVQCQAMTVAATLEALLTALDYWAEVAVLPEARATTTRININRFSDLTERWRPLDGAPSLAGYLRYLDALDESGRAEELDAAELPAEDAVRILTAHGAKGLEWDEVYIPALSSKIFPSSVIRYYDPIDSHVALPYSMQLTGSTMSSVDQTSDVKERKRQLKIRHDHQEWRLAYVAVTRARHRLVFTGHVWHADNVKPRTPSELLTLALESPATELDRVLDEPGPRPEPPEYVPTPLPPDPLFDVSWSDALRNTVDRPEWAEEAFPEVAAAVDKKSEQLNIEFEGLSDPAAADTERPFATSVTNLVALKQCPLKFKWIHHDRLPRKPRLSARKGTEFHRRAELHNLGVLALDDAQDVTYDSPSSEGAVEPSVDPWNVFTASRFSKEHPMLVETPFEITLDGRTLRGKVDAVYGTPDRWEIVDYKSGAPSPSTSKTVQLQAYAVAATEGAISTNVPDNVYVTFAYFGVSPVAVETEAADEQWLDAAHEQITDLLEQAELGPFPAAPTPACRWCDFLHHCPAGKAAVADR
ncbi:MAG: ATP-dependent DNA helicase [Acidimicrobiia bacterium]